MEKVLMEFPIALKGTAKALGGVEVQATTENADAQTALDALKGTLTKENNDLRAELTTAKSEKTKADTKVTELEGKVTTLTSEINDLKAKTPGAARSEARKEGEQAEGASPEKTAKEIEVENSTKAIDDHIKAAFPQFDFE
jgi:chromosome segregation ATPase